MQIYVLDGNFQRIAVVDDFISMIWTDRYTSWGDFELIINKTSDKLPLLGLGTWLSIGSRSIAPDTQEIMTIESIEISEHAVIKGKSLVAILEHRAIGASLTPSGFSYDNNGTSNPAQVIFDLVAYSCGYESAIYTDDSFPNFVVTDSMSPEDPLVDVNIKGGTVYTRVKELCDAYDYGFTMSYWLMTEYEPGNYAIRFDCYKGVDRSSDQVEVPAVIFGEDLDTLGNTKELRSIADYKNVAYVYGKDKAVMVYSGETPATAWDRRVLIVEASDITGTTTKATTNLRNRGLVELKKHNMVMAIDGEIPSSSPHKYGEAYFMGDIVELRTSTGAKQKLRVTEYIYTQDATGERSYPTLSELT